MAFVHLASPQLTVSSGDLRLHRQAVLGAGALLACVCSGPGLPEVQSLMDSVCVGTHAQMLGTLTPTC